MDRDRDRDSSILASARRSVVALAALAALAALGQATGCAGAHEAGGNGSAGSGSGSTAGATLAFRGVRVFDGARVWPRANVVVSDRILAIGDVPIPAGVEVVEGAGHTLLPGLIDSHIHIYDASQLEQSLAFGVTTVLDMFTTVEVMRSLRGDVPGRAEMRSAGILATAPGGHGSEYGIRIPTLTRPDEAQAFVDARLAEGSDYIKIVYDDGSAYGVKFPSLSRETLAAVIAAAHRRGKLAVVHIGDYEEAQGAIDAGADGLAHIFGDRVPPADFGKRVAAAHAFVTPTLSVLRNLHGDPGALADDPAIAPYLMPDARGNLRARFPIQAVGPADAAAKAVAQLRDAGVPILCGTDAPNPGTTHGASMHDELALLVAAGLTPAEALTAATAGPAAAFRLSDRGRIAAGLRADLVLVDGDPTADITRTRHIAGVWRDGKRFDREAVRARVAEASRPAAAGAGPMGLISDFESGGLETRFGQHWISSTDSRVGGTSTVDLAVAAGGAGKSARALAITGEVVAGKGPAKWAGAFFSPGAQAFEPTDLSSRKGVRFQARGDGKTYVVMLFARSRGRMPLTQTFVAGASFAPVELAWSQFGGTDGSDIMGIFIGASPEVGRFALTVDDVELW